MTLLIRKTISSTLSPAFAKYTLLSIGVTFVLLAATMGLLWWSVGLLVAGLADVWALGAQILSGIAGAVIAWFLLPLLIPVIASLFQENLASRIESKEYPELPPAKNEPLHLEVIDSLKFVAWGLFLNILFLPLYFLPIINIGIYYALNGYLISRELFCIVAKRRVGIKLARKAYRSKRRRLFISGIVLVFLTNVPVLCLVAPLLGIVFMVHFAAEYKTSQQLEVDHN